MSAPAAPLSRKEAVKNAKSAVLMVGAGGIGCELLKTLVLSGFEDIEMARPPAVARALRPRRFHAQIDMDTIEISNLNRQFLFRKHNRGEAKAVVARAAVLRFRPAARVVAHVGNVKEARFGPDFVARFSLVLNGLDNLDARRHVNRLCLAAGVPLVESGTAGYLGQVSVHVKGVTQCFECEAKPVPKTFPVCTIRNTPERPIHCVVWAKDMLFAALFGPKGANDLEEADEPSADGGGGGEAEEDPAKETAEEAAERAAFFALRPAEAPSDFATRIYCRAFGSDISRLLRITTMWDKPGRFAPSPLPPPTAAAAALLASSREVSPPGSAAAPGGGVCAALGLTDAHAVWSVDQATAVFLASCARLSQRACAPGAPPLLSFDKDDAEACEFVAAAAALRGASYAIPPLPLFDAKGMAGNIIHAIATTNAIVAGLIVLEATKLLCRPPSAALLPSPPPPPPPPHHAADPHPSLAPRWTYLQQFPSATPRGRLLLMPCAPPGPFKGCYVCGRARLALRLDVGAWTLGGLLDKILRPKLGITQPSVACTRGDGGGGSFSYESGEGLEEDEIAGYEAMRPLPLLLLPGGGLRGGDTLDISDQATSLTLEIGLIHVPDWDATAFPEGFQLEGHVPTADGGADAAAAEAATKKEAAAEEEDDVLIMSDAPPAAAAEGAAAGGERPSAAAAKRKRDAAGGDAAEEPAGKAAKPSAAGGGDDEIIEL